MPQSQTNAVSPESSKPVRTAHSPELEQQSTKIVKSAETTLQETEQLTDYSEELADYITRIESTVQKEIDRRRQQELAKQRAVAKYD